MNNIMHAGLTPTTSNEPSAPSDIGKKVASSNILQSCVNKYAPPACTHFQKALYSDLKVERTMVMIRYTNAYTYTAQNVGTHKLRDSDSLIHDVIRLLT